jgi:hypothetical protein
MIIAVDFDGMIALSSIRGYRTQGEEVPNIPLILALIKAQKKGHKLILWTCRGGEWLQEAIDFCKEYSLEFDAVNENISGDYKEISCKVVADLYIDDRNCSITDFIRYGELE